MSTQPLVVLWLALAVGAVVGALLIVRAVRTAVRVRAAGAVRCLTVGIQARGTREQI